MIMSILCLCPASSFNRIILACLVWWRIDPWRDRGSPDQVDRAKYDACTRMAGMCCRALSTNNDNPQGASRPWDTGRDGFVMGEGAGVLVMESLEHAQARGANIICEYLGSAVSCDAHHMTDPRPDGRGVGMCIENALKDAGAGSG